MWILFQVQPTIFSAGSLDLGSALQKIQIFIRWRFPSQTKSALAPLTFLSSSWKIFSQLPLESPARSWPHFLSSVVTVGEPGQQLLEQKLLRLFTLRTSAWSSPELVNRLLVHLFAISSRRHVCFKTGRTFPLSAEVCKEVVRTFMGFDSLQEESEAAAVVNSLQTPARSHTDHLDWPFSFRLYRV